MAVTAVLPIIIAGILPCEYTTMAPGGDGCRFKLKAKAGSNVQVDLGIAMKTCPSSDLPFISVVLLGGASKLALSSFLGLKVSLLVVMTS